MTVNWEISSIVNWVSAMFHLPFGGAMNSEKIHEKLSQSISITFDCLKFSYIRLGGLKKNAIVSLLSLFK